MNDFPTLADFVPCVGNLFSIWWDDVTSCDVTLVEATALPSQAHPGARRSPFQLKFKSENHTAANFLPQSMYAVTHSLLGGMELFLVPIGPPKDGSTGFIYQALFN